jgi:hypothetical protein
MNWITIIIVGILVIALLASLIIRNKEDEVELEEKLNNDYPKPKDDKGDIEFDEQTK